MGYLLLLFRGVFFSSLAMIGSGAIVIGVTVIGPGAIALISGEPDNAFHFSFQGRLDRI